MSWVKFRRRQVTFIVPEGCGGGGGGGANSFVLFGVSNGGKIVKECFTVLGWSVVFCKRTLKLDSCAVIL